MNQQAAKLFQAGHKQAAVKLLAQALQTDWTHLTWFLQLASYLVAGGDLAEAEELLLKAKQLFPEAQEIDYNLAVIYYQAGKWDRAKALLLTIKQPDLLSDAYYLLAQTAQKNHQLQQALVYALTALDHNNHVVANFLLVGDLLIQLQQFPQAQTYYQKALQLKPQAESYFKLALCEMVNGDHHFSQHFQQAQQLDPAYVKQHQQQLAEIERYLQAQQKDDQDNE